MQCQGYVADGGAVEQINAESSASSSRLAGPPFEDARRLDTAALEEWALRLNELASLKPDEARAKMIAAVRECEDELARRARQRLGDAEFEKRVDMWLSNVRLGKAPLSSVPLELRAEVGRCLGCRGSGEACCEFGRGGS